MTHRDSTVRLPSWLIAASLVVVVVATLTYFITTSNDNTDEAAPQSDSPASTPAPSDDPTDEADTTGEKTAKPDADAKPKNGDKSGTSEKSGDAKKADGPPKKKQQPDTPTVTPDAAVDVYNNAGITNLAESASSNVRAAGFTIGGVDNWYGAIPATTVYYPPGMEQQAELLADSLGVGRMMPAVDPMSSERLSLILTAAI